MEEKAAFWNAVMIKRIVKARSHHIRERIGVVSYKDWQRTSHSARKGKKSWGEEREILR